MPQKKTLLFMKRADDVSVAKSFGLRVRELRKSRGLSQEAFADIAGLDRSYIGGVERGARNISLVNIKRISIALEISMEELFRELE